MESFMTELKSSVGKCNGLNVFNSIVYAEKVNANVD